MIAEKLKKSILQAAIQGKLTKHEPGDGTAAELLQQIAAEKAKLIKEGKIKKEKPLSEITEEEKPFDLPDGWEWCRLVDISSIITDGEHKTPARIKKFQGYYLLSARNVLDDKLQLNTVDYVDKIEFEKISKRCNPKKNDILISCSGSIGRICVVDDDENYVMVRSAAMVRTVFNNEKYIKLALQSSFVQSQVDLLKKQSAQANLFLGAIKSLILPIPPLAEQRRIVVRVEDLLSQVDSLSKDEKKLDALQSTMPERLKASLLQAAIQGKLTERLPGDGNAEDLLAEIAAEKQRLIKEKKIKKEKSLPEIAEEDKPFDLPEGWAWCRLGEITYNHGQKKPNIPFTYVDISSIDNKHQKLGDLSNIIQPDKAPSRARKIIRSGDVIYATVRPYLHNMCIIDRDIMPEPIVSTGFAVLCTPMKVLNQYLFYYLLSPQFDFYANSNENAKGVAYPAINDERLSKAIISLPPLAEQQRIVRRLEELLPLCEGILQDKPRSVLKVKQKEKKNIDSVTVTSDNIKNISSLKKDENSLDKKIDKVKKSTYQIGILDLVDEFASNPDFKKVFLSGLYVYVDRCLCINHPKYVQYNKQNQAVLTEYAKKNKAECCLIFEVTMMMPKDGMTQQTVPITQTSLSSLSGANKEVQANASSLSGTGNEADETERIQRLLKNNFPESLKALMKYKGVTEESLAEALGVSSKTIQRLKKEPEVKRAAITAVCVVMNLNVVVYLDLLNVAGLHPTKSRQDNMIQLILGLRPNLTLAQFNDELEKAGCAALNYGEK